MASIFDLMFAISEERIDLYYHRDTNVFDYRPLSLIEIKNIHTRMNEKLTIGYKDPNNVRFLSFEEINHKEIMKDFIKSGIVYEKDIRKKLFDALRYSKFVTQFIDRLKEFDLYDDFLDYSNDYYKVLFEDWKIANDVKLC